MITNYNIYIKESLKVDYEIIFNTDLKKIIDNFNIKYNIRLIAHQTHEYRTQLIIDHYQYRVISSIDFNSKDISNFNNFSKDGGEVYKYDNYDVLIEDIINLLNFIIKFDLKYIKINDLNSAMYKINSFDLVIIKDNFNKNIIDIVNKDNTIIDNFNNLKKYLNEENLKKLDHLFNAKNFDLL